MNNENYLRKLEIKNEMNNLRKNVFLADWLVRISEDPSKVMEDFMKILDYFSYYCGMVSELGIFKEVFDMLENIILELQEKLKELFLGVEDPPDQIPIYSINTDNASIEINRIK